MKSYMTVIVIINSKDDKQLIINQIKWMEIKLHSVQNKWTSKKKTKPTIKNMTEKKTNLIDSIKEQNKQNNNNKKTFENFQKKTLKIKSKKHTCSSGITSINDPTESKTPHNFT